jgi:hypothetical protein
MAGLVPREEWGRRLSDAIRGALAAGDLPAARRLALEGDGQARSLDKEYALMYRGLGITVRVLLGLLGDMPAHPDRIPLLRRFRTDMIALAARAYTAPPARDAVPALAAANGERQGEDAAAEGAATARLLTALEEVFAAEQSRLARDIVAALDTGDGARARRLVDDKEQGQYVPLHDRIIRFMAEIFAHVLVCSGPAGLLRFHLATAEGQRAGFEKWEQMTPAEFAQTSAYLLKQHMGRVDVSEDGEKFTIEQALCGSGGRLQISGAYAGPGALPFVEGPSALTLGAGRFPVYCSHCPIWNGVAPIQWFGRPHWVFAQPGRPDGSCTLHIYKRRDGAPPEYMTALGGGAGPHR